jgi:DNA-directed RNA polymerase specialized sigma24 family protein
MSNQASSSEGPRIFPNTRWSLVLAARQPQSPESAAALEAICRAYWYPLYAYVRRSGQSPSDAQDLTQEFFCRLLEKRWLDSADREKGRLRTFLVVALKHFMNKERRRALAHRRGGGRIRSNLQPSTFHQLVTVFCVAFAARERQHRVRA